MAVTHTFSSGKADGGDATLVQPSNWNANHTLTGNLSALDGLANAAGYLTNNGSGTLSWSAADISIYETIMKVSGSHIAAKVAGTYMLPESSQPLAVSGTGTLYTVAIVYIDSADYPDINGLTAKFRLRGYVTVNSVAPTGNFTIGLYPVTSGAGATGLKIFTVGSIVASSACTTVTTPTATSFTAVVSSDFARPTNGAYVIACTTTATIAVASLVHIGGALQFRYT